MTKPLTESDLNAIEARCEAATAGPWRMSPASAASDKPARVTTSQMVRGYARDRRDIGIVCEITDGAGRFDDQLDADANFIAAAREDVPRLVAEVRRLRAIVEKRGDE